MNNVEKFKRIATELGDLYEKKNKAYGNSFSDTYKKLGIISAVTRISDKNNRLCNLATNPDIDNLGESLADTLRDMASYCIMTLIEMEEYVTKEATSVNRIVLDGREFISRLKDRIGKELPIETIGNCVTEEDVEGCHDYQDMHL